jgi:hypothetical protein
VFVVLADAADAADAAELDDDIAAAAGVAPTARIAWECS